MPHLILAAMAGAAPMRFASHRLRAASSNPAAALALAADCDRHADLLLSVGRTAQAEAAAHLAGELRARALGVRS